jgi:hypothetical protein
MNREEVRWLLQTIYDAKDAELFLLAQFERGRIPGKVMNEVARERGWINRIANRFFATATNHSTEYAATEVSNAAA